MRDLVTAADVKKWADGQEKTVHIAANTIITPAARDAARDYGIELIEGAAAQTGPRCAANSASPVAEPTPAGVSQAFIAQVVEEVIAALGQGRPRPPAEREADPSGLRLVRSGAGWDAGTNKVKIKPLFDSGDSPNLAAGLLALEGAAPPQEKRGSEVHYLLEGTVAYTVGGREYVARAGDAVLLPANTEVSVAAAGRAKLFFVVYPANWWSSQGRG